MPVRTYRFGLKVRPQGLTLVYGHITVRTEVVHNWGGQMKTVLYAHVSGADQNIAHQEAHARKAGFEIDEVVADEGVSGVAVPLAERPQGKRLFDMLRRGDVLVVRWVDRLGRNYSDVCDNIREFMRRGVVVRTVINGLTFDGATKRPHAEGRQGRPDRLHGGHGRGRRPKRRGRLSGPVLPTHGPRSRKAIAGVSRASIARS